MLGQQFPTKPQSSHCHVDFLEFLPAVKMPLVLCLILEDLTIAESPVRKKQIGHQENRKQMLAILTILKPETKYSFQLSSKSSRSSSSAARVAVKRASGLRARTLEGPALALPSSGTAQLCELRQMTKLLWAQATSP